MQFRFAGFTLDSELREILRGAERVRVEPKVFDLLLFLLDSRARVVAREELLRGVWPDVATTDGSLARAVSLAREALGDRAVGQVIATVRGRGYRIAVPVDVSDAAPVAGAFVGRERELGALHGALDRVEASGQGGAVFVTGEPGIGKSRLVEEFSRAARARGAETLSGVACAGDGAPPFWPWTQMLEAWARARDARTLRAELGREAVALATLAPALVRRTGARERRAPACSRVRQLEAVAAWLARASAPRPLVLCFDDLHAADEDSLRLLAFAATAARARRVLVVATLRESESHEGVARARDACARALDFTCEVPLGGLTVGEVERLLGATLARDDAAALAPLLHARTEGNPFFLHEIARAAAAGGGTIDGPLPHGVRAAIQLRLARLSPACVALLREAAVIGRGFDVRILARACGRDETDVLDRLEEAERAGVLAAAPGRGVRFAHELIREVLYESQSRSERVRAHRRVAEALEALHAGDAHPPCAELAHHFGAALPDGDADRAAHWAIRAGEQALAQLAYEKAAGHFRAAQSALDERPSASPGARGELLLREADAHHRAGAIDAAEKCYWRAIDLARDAGEVELLARAVVGLAHRDIGNKGVVPERRIEVLEQTLAQIDPAQDGSLARIDPAQHGLRARLLAALSADLYWRDLARADALARDAVAAARRADDADALFCALAERAHFLVLPAQRTERDAVSAEMLAAAIASGDLEREFLARKERFHGFASDGRRTALDAELRELAALAKRLAQPGLLDQVRIARAARALWRGDRADAETLVPLPEADPCALPIAPLAQAPHLFLLRRMQGRLAEIEPALQERLRRFPRVLSFRCAYAQFLVECGRQDEARERWLELRDLAALRVDANHALDLAVLADLCVALGDAEAAPALYERLQPHAGTHLVLAAIVSLGSADRHLGRLATLLGDLDAAAAHLEQAARLESAMGARLWEAYVERDRAALCVRRGDASGARRHAAASTRIARALSIAL